MSHHQLETIGSAIDAPLVDAVRTSWKDILGIVASISCAIHCAIMPMAIGYLPLLGLEFLADESFHRWMVFVCFGIAILAFVPGWKRHRSFLPGAVGAVGLAGIAAAAFFVTDSCCAANDGSELIAMNSAAEVCTESCCDQCEVESPPSNDLSVASISSFGSYASWITPLGGLLLVGSHLLNHRYTCQRKCCAAQSTSC